jgi:hypothetical protein
VKIGVLYNCQNVGIADSLRALLPGAEVINYAGVAGLPKAEQARRAAELSDCDHLIMTHLAVHHGKLSLRAMQQTARSLHVLPAFAFGGYHPDTIYVQVDGQVLNNITGGYQSRIAVAGYLAGLSPRDTAALYNKLVFARLGYFNAFDEQSKLLIMQWGRAGIDAGPLLAGWQATGCFTHSINHPKMPVLLDLARVACARMGLAVQDGIEAAALPDHLARGPIHPVFPDIAASLGIAPEGAFCAGTVDGTRETFAPAAFVARCFVDFDGVAPAVLLEAPGVADALSALGLSRSRRDAARRAPGPGMVLMTHHGTLLRQGAAGQFSHLPLAIPASQAEYLRADGAALGLRQASGPLAGTDMVATRRRGCVTLMRARQFLCAEAGSQAASFSRESAGEWESFLPLHEESIALLARIEAADWQVTGTGELIPQHLIRVEAGPVLRFGRWTIDLAGHFPRAEDDGTILVVLEGEPCRAREMPRPPAPLRPGLPDSGKRMVLVGAPAWLPPPVTLCDADRAWMYGAASWPDALNGKSQPANAILLRAADQPVGAGPAGPAGSAGSAGPVRPALPARPALAGLSVQFCPETTAGLGWMGAAIRLHVLSAVAGDGAFLLPPGVAPDVVQAWHALGFQDLAYRAVPPGGAMASDLLWLDAAEEAGLPGEAWAGLRARIGRPAPGGRKLFWRDGVTPGLEAMLAGQGFEPVDAHRLPVVARIALVSQASWIVGASGQVPLAFCLPGTRFIELSDRAAFGCRDWMVAVKLGLMHGVLPGATPESLLRLVRLMDARVSAA